MPWQGNWMTLPPEKTPCAPAPFVAYCPGTSGDAKASDGTVGMGERMRRWRVALRKVLRRVVYSRSSSQSIAAGAALGE